MKKSLVLLLGVFCLNLMAQIPSNGQNSPSFEGLNQVITEFMGEFDISAASVYLSSEGDVFMHKSFGWSDENKTTALTTDAMFRLASLTKPVTAAAVIKLAQAGVLDTNAFAFNIDGNQGLLNVNPFGGQPADNRLKDIRVHHLLRHHGGWNHGVIGDPLWDHVNIANNMSVPSPISQAQLVNYVLGTFGLSNNPGTTYNYSNFGYVVLGLIIEATTGREYAEYVQTEIFAPECVASTEIEQGRSLPEFYNPREPFLETNEAGWNVFNPTQWVKHSEGATYMESLEAAGGLIGTAEAYTQFLETYWITGYPKTPGWFFHWIFYGSVPGINTVGRQFVYADVNNQWTNVSFTVLLNKRQGVNQDYNSIIEGRIINYMNGFDFWPNDPFFVEPNECEPVSSSSSVSSSSEPVSSSSEPVSSSSVVTLPNYGNKAAPGKLEAEFFDAFNEFSGGNNGNWSDRNNENTGVDMEWTGDVGGGANVGWTDAGEWLEYNFDVTQSGSYEFTLRVASAQGTRNVSVSVNGASAQSFSYTGSQWQSYQDLVTVSANLSSGQNTVRVTFLDGATNLNYIDVEELAVSSSSEPVSSSSIVVSSSSEPVSSSSVVVSSSSEPVSSSSSVVSSSSEPVSSSSAISSSSVSTGSCGDHGVYADGNGNAVVYQKDHGWTGGFAYLCIDYYCLQATRGGGWFTRVFSGHWAGEQVFMEAKVQDNSIGQYLLGENVTISDACVLD